MSDCPKAGPADLIGLISLWLDDGFSRNQRGFWLDPAFHRRGLMTEAADRVTDYAFRELGWPHLWLSNALDNHSSRRIKEKEGAQLVDLLIGRFVGGESTRMVWLLTRQNWLSRRQEALGQPAKKERNPAETTIPGPRTSL